MLERFRGKIEEFRDKKREEHKKFAQEVLNMGVNLYEQHPLGWTVAQITDSINFEREEKEQKYVTGQEVSELIEELRSNNMLYASKDQSAVRFQLSPDGVEFLEFISENQNSNMET